MRASEFARAGGGRGPGLGIVFLLLLGVAVAFFGAVFLSRLYLAGRPAAQPSLRKAEPRRQPASSPRPPEEQAEHAAAQDEEIEPPPRPYDPVGWWAYRGYHVRGSEAPDGTPYYRLSPHDEPYEETVSIDRDFFRACSVARDELGRAIPGKFKPPPGWTREIPPPGSQVPKRPVRHRSEDEASTGSRP